MIKKLFMFIFFVAAIAFCIFAAVNHIEMYKALGQLSFSGWDNIKASLANIIILFCDLIVFLTTFVAFISFLIHFMDTRNGGKQVIKCGSTIGSYFVIFMIFSFVASVIASIGESGFVDFIKETVMSQEFYLPFGLDILAAIFLVASIMHRKENKELELQAEQAE